MDILGALKDPEFMRGVRQGILDAANRGIAATLGAPVDIATMVARPFGYSTPERQVVGSSEWLGKQMEDLGMVSTARNPVAEMLASVIMPAGVTTQGKRLYELEQAAARNLAAPRTLNTPGYGGQRGAVYVGDKLTTNIDDANEFAQKIRNLGAQYRPNIIEDAGGSVYVTVDKLPLTKSGAVAKNRTPIPTNFKARFADHPQYWGASISSDPITQNTAEDAYQLFAHEILGQQAPETITKAFFVPQDKVGKITEKTLKTMPSLSGKSMVQKYIEETRPFTFYEPKLNNQPMGLMGAPKQTGLQELTTLNPTGSVFSNYDPISRAIAPLGKNITTLDKTMGGLADDTVTIYRGAPKTQKTINPGDFITTDAQLARDYAGTGHVISQKVRKKDILDDMLEPLGGEYIYRPAK